MPLDPELLKQVLGTPPQQEVTRSPIVTAVILADPSHAELVAAALDDPSLARVDNARQILAQFGPSGAPHLLRALRDLRPETRQDALSLLAAMLALEDERVIRAALADAGDDLDDLLTDTRTVPDDLAPSVERDFRGRVCDHAFLALLYLLRPDEEQSLFRRADEHARDQMVAALRRELGRMNMV